MKVKNKRNDSIPTPPWESITIEDGRVHYAIHGSGNGEWVILVHGLLTPMFVWDFLADELENNGFRVMRYDHFGRGFSDCPQVEYKLELYIRQLENLLSTLNIDEKVNLVGWSMGSVICSSFADRHPEKVNKLVLIAPGMFVKMPLMGRLGLKSPLFAWSMKKYGEKIVLKGLRKHFNKPEKFQEYFDKVQAQMKSQGVIESLISTMRHFPVGYGKGLYSLGHHPRPVLIVWGEHDEITPYRNRRKVRKLFKNSELFTVENAGHAPHYEYRAMVNEAIVKFLQR